MKLSKKGCCNASLLSLQSKHTHTHTYSDVFQRLDKPLYGAKEGPCHLSPLEISPWTHCTRALQCPLLIYAHKHTHILSCTGFFLTYVCIHALRSRKIIMKQSPIRKCLVGAYHINVKSLVSEHLVLVYLVCMNLNSSIYIFRRDFCITSIAKYNCKNNQAGIPINSAQNHAGWASSAFQYKTKTINKHFFVTWKT